MTDWRWADVSAVRARMAEICLRNDGDAESSVGEIVLRDHQREAAGRLRHAIDRYGGALLADDVGLGKTFTALAVARAWSPVLVVAPAALARMWRAALDRSGVDATFVSIETLSHRDLPHRDYALVIVDEAHHARNPATQRYGRLAELTRGARVLLLSATPVHNATGDLHALLALFLGSRAERMTPADLSGCIVRRARDQVELGITPRRSDPVWLSVEGAAVIPEALLAIPPACPAKDGGDGGTLVTLSLVRAWASSEAALRGALLRRIAQGEGLADALAAGRHPTRSEMRAWVVGDDATQLAFPEIVASGTTGVAEELASSVRRHLTGVHDALATLSANGGADERRAALIREIVKRHPEQRVVVFSQFVDTVRAMFAKLRADGYVAAVTANGASIAGGPIARNEAIARFAPVATGSPPPSRAETIRLLLATDLLSEGLNLQDASVVVHLDLPWTAARLTQRLGRIWRIGSPHDEIHEYAVAPPAAAAEVLRVVQLLTAKAGAAAASVGDALNPLLAGRHPTVDLDTIAAPQALESLRRLLRAWAGATHDDDAPTTARDARDDKPTPTLVAAVRGEHAGWIAGITSDRDARLIVSRDGDTPATEPQRVLEVCRGALGTACIAAPARTERALREIAEFLRSETAAVDAGVSGVGTRVHAAAAGRIAAVAAAAPAHRRVAVSRLAASARRVVSATRSAGGENRLRALIASQIASEIANGPSAEAWLERVIELGARAALVPNADSESPACEALSHVDAVLLIVPRTH